MSTNPTASRRGAVRRSRPWRSLCRSIVFPGVRGLLGLVRGPPQGIPGGHRGAPGRGMSRGLHRAVFAGLCLASLCAVYLLAANIHIPGYGSQLDWVLGRHQLCSGGYIRSVLHENKFSAVRRMHNPFVTWGDVARTLWGIIPLLPPLRTVDRLPYFSEGTERQYQALLRAVPDSTVPWELSRHACKRCVVVGNGFVLSNSSLGKEIDKHDIIIRMNEAPVTGYEQDVGSRTSLRLFYPESSGLERALWGHDARSTLAVFVPYKVQDLLWLRDAVEGFAEEAASNELPYLLWQLGYVENISSAAVAASDSRRPGFMWLRTGTRDKKQRVHVFWRRVATRLSYSPERIRILRPDIIRSVAFDLLKFAKKKQVKHCQVPTMGLMALGLAMHFCDEVSIAGFGYNMSALQQPVHYYSNDTMAYLLAQAGSHSIRSEQRLLRRLIAVGAIADLCSSAPRN
ncbi:type 2 lactosamine alpha-2,3-sialyltransferase-like isoform X1 [Lethenteron reissneri]|uniref:type 2 lactosamine alpha-2,3-sialyltransferase-like isoform X1 n=2 Tax=Lethenteron reissneri TaxID=7753 RepID=UPI002AB7E2F8|nr:type 2 lactosamine alpha-2,3-sialyltransferase-like isoform X1 [Lethenteron reissneri]